MKRVIFICLLSLSACLSDQSIPQDAANKASVDPKAQMKEVQDAAKNLSGVPSNVPTQSASVSPAQASPPVQNLPANQNIPPQTTNSTATASTVTDPKSNTTKAEDNKTGNKLPETKETEGKPSDEKIIKPAIDEHKNVTSTETTSKIENKTTVIEDKEKKGTNSTKSEIMKPTEAPALQARGFDGPSFIGGIILTLGLIAISFMGYKYYKNQKERNYYGTL